MTSFILFFLRVKIYACRTQNLNISLTKQFLGGQEYNGLQGDSPQRRNTMAVSN